MNRPICLSVAGSDPSGGAGIQADLKTMTALGVYGMTAITALTVQNTCGVQRVYPADPCCLEEQLEAVLSDLPPAAAKTGMLVDERLLCITAEAFARYAVPNVVVDPVMVSTSGRRLLDERAIGAMKKRLLPRCRLVTPNLPEMEALWGKSIRSRKDREDAAREIAETWGCAVLCKGGHSTEDADDLLYWEEGAVWFRAKRMVAPNNHGTGCTLSAAIAAELAKGSDLPTAVEFAKAYLTGALAAGLNLGSGNGPLDHLWKQGEE